MHHEDAYCIAISCMDIIEQSDYIPQFDANCYRIKQFRRHDRSCVKSQTERTYSYNGHMIAKNKNKRTAQHYDSLKEWYEKQVLEFGKKTADIMRSQLTVKKSIRRYNNMNRVLPGTGYIYEGNYYVLGGQLSNGKYYYKYGDNTNRMNASKCAIIPSGGLMFLLLRRAGKIAHLRC